MTDKLFFDTDCLSSFLCVGREDIILLNYRCRIVIPQFVYDEFCSPVVRHLRIKLDSMLNVKDVYKMEIAFGTPEAILFKQLTKKPIKDVPPIGKGEAAALVLAKANNGIIASNNLRDIKDYAKDFGIPILTAADILVEALGTSYITETEGNTIWTDMRNKNRKLPTNSFSEFLRTL
jgi:predicted nucleic acid-binding protein